MPPTGETPAKRTVRKAKAPSHRKSPRERPGRPLRLDEVVGHREGDGRPVTIADRIISAVDAGNYVETAAATAGVSKNTLYDWLRTGARLLADKHEGRRSRFSADERRLMEFSDAVGAAIATSEARDVTTLARLGQGGIPVVVETVKVDKDGNVLESSTRSTATLPEASVLEWRLERRFRERWGRQVEVTGAGGGPLTVDLGASARETIASELEKIGARLGAAAGPRPAAVPVTPPDQ